MRPGISAVRTVLAGALVAAAFAPAPGRAAVVGPGIYHVPALYVARNTSLHVETYASCESACTARVFYRSTVQGAPIDLIASSEPPWPNLVMGRDPGINLGGQVVYRFFVDLPASVADTRGVDYVIKVTDGPSSSYSPGTPATLGQANGLRIGSHHVFVTAPVNVVHVPVAEAAYRTSIPLRVDATCATDCTATLFFRRTGLLQPSLVDFDDPPPNPAESADVQWVAIGMRLDGVNPSLQQYGAAIATFSAEIPSSYVDTRGVDYTIKVSDGRTRAYWPGTPYNGYVTPIDGARTGWQHVYVLNPVLAAHAQTAYTTTHGATLLLQMQSVCWTESCFGAVEYHSFGGPIRRRSMTKVAETQGSGFRLITWSVTIPGIDVAAPTFSYRFQASDGFTNAWSPGTFYNGYYVKTDGSALGEYTIYVL
ncbi:MAG: hypothetical protein ACRDJM_02825 [Actinomycetota bacterium]